MPVSPGWESFIAAGGLVFMGLDPGSVWDRRAYQGIAEVHAIVASAHLPQIASDPAVLLSDVSVSAMYRDMSGPSERDLVWNRAQNNTGEMTDVYDIAKALGWKNFEK